MRSTTHGRVARRREKLRGVSLLTSRAAAWRTGAAAVRREHRRFRRLIRPEPGYRWLPLFTRVILVNAAVLVTATLVFAITPATVSFPLAVREAVVLALGLAVIVVASTFLLRLTFRPLGRLVRLMGSIDLLQPGQRLELSGGVEVRRVISTFNDMLERLERERRESNRRALTAREGERRRIGQELHDEIGQRLTGLLLQLGRTLRDAPDETRSELLTAQELARSTLGRDRSARVAASAGHPRRPGVGRGATRACERARRSRRRACLHAGRRSTTATVRRGRPRHLRDRAGEHHKRTPPRPCSPGRGRPRAPRRRAAVVAHLERHRR